MLFGVSEEGNTSLVYEANIVPGHSILQAKFSSDSSLIAVCS